LQLGRALARWARYDLIALDEVGYIPLAEVGAEFLFQVIAERAEKAAVIVTTNLPFSEWTKVIPNARLCKALIDRITDRANIIETGAESYRFRRILEKRKGKNGDEELIPRRRRPPAAWQVPPKRVCAPSKFLYRLQQLSADPKRRAACCAGRVRDVG